MYKIIIVKGYYEIYKDNKLVCNINSAVNSLKTVKEMFNNAEVVKCIK